MAMAGSTAGSAVAGHAAAAKAANGPGPSPIDSLDVFKYTDPRKPGRARAATAGSTLGVSTGDHGSTNGFAGHSSTPQPGQLHGGLSHHVHHHHHHLHHAHSFSVGTGLTPHGHALADAHPTSLSPASAGMLSRSEGLVTQSHHHLANGAHLSGPALGASARGSAGTPTARQGGAPTDSVVRTGPGRQFTVTEQVLQEHETPNRPMFVIESVARRTAAARQRLPYRVGRFLVHSIVPTPSDGNLPPKRQQAKHSHFRSTQVLRLNKGPRADSANVVIHFSKQGAINVSQGAHGGGGKGQGAKAQGSKGAGAKGQRRRRTRVTTPATTPSRANGGGKQRRRQRKHSGSGSALGVAGGTAGAAGSNTPAAGGGGAANGSGSGPGEDEQEGFDFASIGVTDTDVPDFASVAYSEAGSEAGSEAAVGTGLGEGGAGGEGEDDVGAQPGDGAAGFRATPGAVPGAQPRYVYGAPAAAAASGWHPGYAHAMQQLATHAASSNNMLRFLINSLHSAGMLQQAQRQQVAKGAGQGAPSRAKPSHSSLRLTDELRQQVESLVLTKNDLTKRNRELRKEARDLRAQLEAAEKQQTVLKQQLERARGSGAARNGTGAAGGAATNGAAGAASASKDADPSR